MTRLIDEEEAFKVLSAYYKHSTPVQDSALHDALSKVPTAKDEPIRCKDCKYNSNTEGNYVNCDIIPQMFGKTPDNNYCSYAEPKEQHDH